MGCFGLGGRRTSGLATMRPSFWARRSTTGVGEMWWAAMSVRASARVGSGLMVTGFTTIPASNFFTLRTSFACSAMARLRWMTPSPPDCAMAIASALSVTVSIAAEISGMPRLTSRVSRVRVSVSVGRIDEAAGTSRTSSKVSACRISMLMPSLPMGEYKVGALLYTIGVAREAFATRGCHAGLARSGAMPIAAFTKRPAALTALRHRAETLGHDIDLRRFGPARRRLAVAQAAEVALQRFDPFPLGSALEDLRDEGAARRPHLACQGTSGVGQRPHAQMVGGGMARGGRRHVAQHRIGRAAQPRAQRFRSLRIEEILLQQQRAGNALGGERIDADHASLARLGLHPHGCQ